jgi:hypothetical protein
MSNGAQPASGVAGYRTMRELGSRSPRSYAALREPHELVVIYRFARAEGAKAQAVAATFGGADGSQALDADAMALLVRDARCLAKNWHPNIARIRHVEVVGSELTVASELVDGATLGDLLTAAAAKRAKAKQKASSEPLLPLPVIARILLDVLVGLQGLHGLRDGIEAPLGTIHGALCPSNIVVGKDGVARILNPLRARPVRVGASDAVGYAAPEALDVGGTRDLRADLHAVGVIAWEALTGRRLYDERDPAKVLARQREEEIAPPAIPAGSPFASLADVVMRAVAFDPALRFKSAAEMGGALRSVAGARIAAGSVVAACVAELAGERIRARRVELDPASTGTRRRASEQDVRAAKTPASAGAPAEATPTPSEILSAAGGSDRVTLPPSSMDPRDAAPVDVPPPPKPVAAATFDSAVSTPFPAVAPGAPLTTPLPAIARSAPPKPPPVARKPAPSSPALPASAPRLATARGSEPRLTTARTSEPRLATARGSEPRLATARGSSPALAAASAVASPAKAPPAIVAPAKGAPAKAPPPIGSPVKAAPTMASPAHEQPAPVEDERVPSVIVAQSSQRLVAVPSAGVEATPESLPSSALESVRGPFLDSAPEIAIAAAPPVQAQPSTARQPEPHAQAQAPMRAPMPAAVRSEPRQLAAAPPSEPSRPSLSKTPVESLAPPPPRDRTRAAIVLGCAIAILLLGGGFALRAMLRDDAPKAIATPSVGLPSTAVTAPGASANASASANEEAHAAAAASAKATADEEAKAAARAAEEDAKGKGETTPKTEAAGGASATGAVAPTGAVGSAGVAPKPVAPRPKSTVYEPLGI